LSVEKSYRQWVNVSQPTCVWWRICCSRRNLRLKDTTVSWTVHTFFRLLVCDAIRSPWSLLWRRILHGSLLMMVISVYFVKNSLRPSVKCSGKWSFQNRHLIDIWQMECDRDWNTFRRFLTDSETLKREYSKHENHFHGFFIRQVSRLAISR
jgi:hypothetical protein